MSDEQPVFDLSNLSWRESKSLAVLQLRMQEAQTADAMEKAFGQIDAFLARVLVSVPRAWLVKDAPADLDWSDAESLNWIQGKKVGALMKALGAAREPEDASGN